METVDNNTLEIRNLLSSIILFISLQDKSRKKIERDDIEQYSARTRGENGQTLFRAIAQMDLEHAGLIVKSILLSEAKNIPSAFTTVLNQFRLLESCLELHSTVFSEDELFKSASYLSTSYFPAFKGVSARDKDAFRSAMRNYTLEDARRIIIYLGKMDNELKAAGTDTQQTVFEMILVTVILHKGRESNADLNPNPLDISIGSEAKLMKKPGRN